MKCKLVCSDFHEALWLQKINIDPGNWEIFRYINNFDIWKYKSYSHTGILGYLFRIFSNNESALFCTDQLGHLSYTSDRPCIICDPRGCVGLYNTMHSFICLFFVYLLGHSFICSFVRLFINSLFQQFTFQMKLSYLVHVFQYLEGNCWVFSEDTLKMSCPSRDNIASLDKPSQYNWLISGK